MKVAIVHDWLTGMRGGERCLETFLDLYPEADIFTLIHVPGSTSSKIDARVKQVSFLNKLPGIQKYYRYLLASFPIAINSFDFKDYDLVISLSHAVAKNVRVPQGIPHISYCFTPMRYIWDEAYSYFGKLTPVLWPLIKVLRAWDRKASKEPTAIVAISRFVASRVRRYYARNAELIYPPVDLSWIKPCKRGEVGEAFLYAGALVPYKRVDLVIEAFKRVREPLWIAGGGPEEARLRRIATPNIKFLGKVSDSELALLYRNCRALIFPGKEDFGMVPVECMAAGRPVIAGFHGALRESIQGVPAAGRNARPGRGDTGVFVRTKGDTVVLADLVESLLYFIEHEPAFSPQDCAARARLFELDRFVSDWNALLIKYGLEWATSNRISELKIRHLPEDSIVSPRSVVGG